MDGIGEDYGVDQAATGSAQPEPVVSVRGLVKRYGSREAVAGIELGVKHVTHVLGKLGAANRTKAVARARRLGLIPADPGPAPVAPSGEGSPRRDIPPSRHLRVTPHGGRDSYRSRRARPTGPQPPGVSS